VPDIKKESIVAFTPEQMYTLVNDIDKYPDFVPWCRATEILHQDEDEIRASMTFEGGGFQKSFTTSNRLQPHKMIELKLVNGPFRHLEGFWRFDHHENDQCRILFDLEFEFSSKLLSLAFGPVFHQVANMLVDCFAKRAEVVYGNATD